MKTKAVKYAIGYVRVSTSEQAENGCSLEAQRDRIRAWAAANDYKLLSVCVDEGVSGGKMNGRLGLHKALDMACQRGAALVVYSLSRLARSTRDALEISERLRRAKADLVSQSERIDTTTAAGKMIFRLMAVLAEFERDLVAERTRTAMQHLRTQGRRVSGRIPFGYELDPDGQHLIENPAEQETITRIRRWHETGRSTRTIARLLNNQGIKTKLGRVWSHTQVHRVLQKAT